MVHYAVLVLIALLVEVVNSWHAYNRTKVVDTDNGCESYESATRIMSINEFDQMKLWPGLMKQFDVENGESLYGFAAGMREIWKNQFPSDCKNAKFLVSGGWPYGFGSRIHVEGWGLALAMNLGRVYLPHPDGDNIFWETSIPFCRERGEVGLTCFYEAWSNCTMTDALTGLQGDVNSLRTVHPPDLFPSFQNEEERQRIVNLLQNDKSLNIVYTTGQGSYDGHMTLPHSVKHIVECSPMREDIPFYWWRAISASFLLRPNAPMLDYLAKMTNLALTERDNCIAMFVRHGDKGIEMKLQPFQIYFEVAQHMWDNGYVPGHGKQRLDGQFADRRYLGRRLHENPSLRRRRLNEDKNGTIFLSTDDPEVIAEAEIFGKNNGWKILYTNLFDRATQTARLDWNAQHQKGTRAVHDDLEYISMILNLQYALKCEAWVCTIASNSCRLIDELRATIGGKANRHFADISEETCSHPPCIGHGLTAFGE